MRQLSHEFCTHSTNYSVLLCHPAAGISDENFPENHSLRESLPALNTSVSNFSSVDKWLGHWLQSPESQSWTQCAIVLYCFLLEQQIKQLLLQSAKTNQQDQMIHPSLTTVSIYAALHSWAASHPVCFLYHLDYLELAPWAEQYCCPKWLHLHLCTAAWICMDNILFMSNITSFVNLFVTWNDAQSRSENISSLVVN